MPASWSAKDERMYRHIKESSGSKQIAAATVNKHRSKRSKKRKRH